MGLIFVKTGELKISIAPIASANSDKNVCLLLFTFIKYLPVPYRFFFYGASFVGAWGRSLLHFYFCLFGSVFVVFAGLY